MIDPIGAHWYVVQTQVNREILAAQNLMRQGYEIYLPRYLKRRRHARKLDYTAKPLFPRYMFVAIDRQKQRWRSVQSTIGVAHLVCIGDKPAMLPEAVIHELKSFEDDKGFIKMEKKPAFAPGDGVRVLVGAFTECLGLFDGFADHERVSILLDLLGRKVRVCLAVDMVAAA